MLGAIAGDIIGSAHEGTTCVVPGFPLFSENSRFTDDTLLTLAVAEHLVTQRDLATLFHETVARHPERGWGAAFFRWAQNRSSEPYGSHGNGAAMRVIPVAWWAATERDLQHLAESVTCVTHDHPEGIKGGVATALAAWLALHGAGKETIQERITGSFGYDLETTLDERSATPGFDTSCQGTVPAAIRCVLEADNYEHAVRNAVQLGGDTDTLACIAGGIAETLFGVPEHIATAALDRLHPDMYTVITQFFERVSARPDGR